MEQARDSSQFEAALKVVDRRYNAILFAGLGVALVLTHIYENSHLKRPLFDGAMLGIFFTSLICMAVLLAREKNRIARAFGLACQECKFLPLAGIAIRVFRSGRCPSCGTKYQSGAPSEALQAACKVRTPERNN